MSMYGEMPGNSSNSVGCRGEQVWPEPRQRVGRRDPSRPPWGGRMRCGGSIGTPGMMFVSGLAMAAHCAAGRRGRMPRLWGNEVARDEQVWNKLGDIEAFGLSSDASCHVRGTSVRPF